MPKRIILDSAYLARIKKEDDAIAASLSVKQTDVGEVFSSNCLCYKYNSRLCVYCRIAYGYGRRRTCDRHSAAPLRNCVYSLYKEEASQIAPQKGTFCF